MSAKKLFRFFPVVFYGLLIVFLILYLRSIDFSKFDNIDILWPLLIISAVFSIVARYWQIGIWLVLLNGLGAKALLRSASQLSYVYAKSWLGRYIPGTAPWLLGKIYFASKLGVSKNKLAVSSLLEGSIQVVAVLALSFLMLIFDSRLDVINVNIKIFMAVLTAGLLLIIYPRIFNKIISIAYKLLKKQEFSTEHYVDGKTISRGAILYTIAAILNGISIFFLAKAIYPDLSYNDSLFVIGASNLATAIGMIVIFAPSGLGVKEGIQLVLFSLIMPTEFALLITIATRLWSIVMDLVFFVMALLAKNLSKNPNLSSD